MERLTGQLCFLLIYRGFGSFDGISIVRFDAFWRVLARFDSERGGQWSVVRYFGAPVRFRSRIQS